MLRKFLDTEHKLYSGIFFVILAATGLFIKSGTIRKERERKERGRSKKENFSFGCELGRVLAIELDLT